MKLKYFSLIFSITGILILYLISKLSQPVLINISEMHEYEGKSVTIKGLVKEHHLTKYGGQIITIFDENSTTEIFVEGKMDIEYGDKIKVTGEVQKYQDRLELIVNDNHQVKILQKWKNITMPLWQLAENPTKYLDVNVNVSGYVEFISNENFYLVDLEKKHSLLVLYASSKNVTIYPGQKVYVSGKFCFDKENFRYKLRVYKDYHRISQISEE
jgi:DNA/RNA endonuclease YhcR with UshA esterase domain